MNWTKEEAIALCCEIEAISPPFGAHVALTGGCLYKEGLRKDADVMFYRIRQIEKIDTDGLFSALESIGFTGIKGFGWVFKGNYKSKPVDLFLPEEIGGEYVAESQE